MPHEILELASRAVRDPKFTTVRIDITNSSDPETLTIYTPDSGHRFIVFHLYLRVEGTTGDVTFLSGSTQITGDLDLAASDAVEWKNAPFPVFKGRARDEAFKVTLASSTGIQLNGFALIGDSTQ